MMSYPFIVKSKKAKCHAIYGRMKIYFITDFFKTWLVAESTTVNVFFVYGDVC